MKYKETHSFHVGDRILKTATTVGGYIYSKHDLSWIDFLRSPIIMDDEVINNMVHSY